MITPRNYAQELLVVDTNQANLLIHNIYDTLWNGLPCEPSLMLYVDADEDGFDDYNFRSECGAGSWGYFGELYMSTYTTTDEYYFAVDNMVIDTIFIDPGPEFIVDTFEVVEKYSYGDTIYADDLFYNSETLIALENNIPQGPNGPGSSLSINDWIGGDHYAGIKLEIGGQLALGWLKIEVLHAQALIVKHSAYYVPNLEISELTKYNLQIQPNPARDYFKIQNIGYTHLRLIDVSGHICIDQSLAPGSQRIDITNLIPGLYIVQVIGENEVDYSKLVKK